MIIICDFLPPENSCHLSSKHYSLEFPFYLKVFLWILSFSLKKFEHWSVFWEVVVKELECSLHLCSSLVGQ